MREIRLVGGITAVELRDGTLTVTVDGQDLAFAVGAGEAEPVAAPRQRRQRQTNGHAQETPSVTDEGQATHYDA